MTRGSRKSWRNFALGLAWFYLLLWPLLGIRDGELHFDKSFSVWLRVAVVAGICFVLYRLGRRGVFDPVLVPAGRLRTAMAWVCKRRSSTTPSRTRMRSRKPRACRLAATSKAPKTK